MAYKQEEFVKELNGVKAPKGFHYMPNGKLMNDANHIAQHGYINKTISAFNIDLKDISHLGETRSFSIQGDNGSYFSLQIYDNSNNYYDFNNGTWVSTITGLNKVRLSGNYNSSISFTANSSSLKTYTIYLITETAGNHQTFHTSYKEVRNQNNSININKSTGSNSNVLIKKMYQDVERKLYLSCIAPSLYATITDTVDGATSSSNRAVFDNKLSAKGAGIGDLLTSTDAAIGVWTLVDKINPDGDNQKEIELNRTDSLSDGSTVTFTPPFNGMTPHKADSTTGRATILTSSGASFKTDFSITVTAPSGRTIRKNAIPSTNDLCTYTDITFGSAGSAIQGEDTSSSSLFYRWPVTNIAGLSGGMVLDPSRSGGGTNTTTPATISGYNTSQTLTRVVEGDYSTRIVSGKLSDVTIPAVDPGNNEITAIDRNGRITAQAGSITFNKQQAAALASDSSVSIFGYGEGGIKSLTGMIVKLSNITTELTQVSTTLTGVCSNSTTIALTNVEGIAIGSVVRGPGISASAANPTVVSKSAQTGGGNIVVSAAQTIENGQTLYFDGAGTTLKILGTIEVENMAIADTTLYFDVERFLVAR